MIKLDDEDIDVLSLLADRPLYAPPPLVLGIIEELKSSRLTFFADDHWHPTPLALDIVAKHMKSDIKQPEPSNCLPRIRAGKQEV